MQKKARTGRCGLGSLVTNCRGLDREALTARRDVKFKRFEFRRPLFEGCRPNIRHTSFKATMRCIDLCVLQPVKREAIDLALAKMVGADHVAVVIFMAI